MTTPAERMALDAIDSVIGGFEQRQHHTNVRRSDTGYYFASCSCGLSTLGWTTSGKALNRLEWNHIIRAKQEATR